jgi:hypothetical protein
MLLLKKAEVEQQLQTELQRIRNIEAHLQLLRSTETAGPFDVVIKQIPAQSVLSVRTVCQSLDDGLGIFEQIMTRLPEKNADGFFFAILHSNGLDEENIDVEIGRTIAAKKHAPVALQDNLTLCFHELPAVATMATFVMSGESANLLTGFNSIRFSALNLIDMLRHTDLCIGAYNPY